VERVRFRQRAAGVLGVMGPVILSATLIGCKIQGEAQKPAQPSPCPLAYDNRVLHPPSSALLSIAAGSKTDAWAVGFYTDGSNQIAHTLADQWDGKAWRSVPTPNHDCDTWNELRSVSIAGSADVWAVGATGSETFGPHTPLIEHWDGLTWSTMAAPALSGRDGELNAVSALDSSHVWAVGSYTSPAGNRRPLTEFWNGRNWSVVPGPAGGQDSTMQAVVTVGPADAWAAGQWDRAPELAHWNGTSWSAWPGAPPPKELAYSSWYPDARFYGIAATGAADVWAVGSFLYGPFVEPLAEHWDGSTWSLKQGKAVIHLSLTESQFESVVALSKGDVWALEQSFLVKRWDGTTWNAISTARETSVLTAISGSGPSDIWVVGYGSDIKHWTGQSWSDVPPPQPYWPVTTATPAPATAAR
jgi:hypothetical protein